MNDPQNDPLLNPLLLPPAFDGEDDADRDDRLGDQLDEAPDDVAAEAETRSIRDEQTVREPTESASGTMQWPAGPTAVVSESSIDLPKFVGFAVQEKIGQGGMGSVYLATDRNLGRKVAIKVLNAAAASTAKIRERFLLEAQTVASLTHANIAQLYSANERAGQPFLVMEYVDGGSLQEKVGNSPQPPAQAAAMVTALARAMQYCHEQGVVHRDLKPSNVLVDSNGDLKIADFGLAKTLHSDSQATRTGEILGTPGYMAPEQASGVVKTLGPTCDVYGLGGILYRLLTGRVPFDSPDPVRTVMMVLSDVPVSPKKLQPGIPRDLETICLKCLEKSPRSRYRSAQALAEDLERFAEGRPIQARPAGAIEKAIKWSRRRPAAALLIATLALAIPIVFGGMLYHSRQLALALERTQRLASQGSDFSEWVIRDHINQLRMLHGTTTIQRDVVARAQAYLDASTPDAPQSAKFLARHADAYRILANIYGSSHNQNLGQTELALKNYQSAISLYEKAIIADPKEAATYRLRAVCYANMSDLVVATEGRDARMKLLQKAVKTLDASPEKNGSQYWLAYLLVHQTLAEQHVTDNQFDDAFVEIDRVEATIPNFADDLAQVIPETKMWVARTRAQAYEAKGDYDRAVTAATAAVTICRESLAESEDEPALLQQLTANLILLGDNQCYCRLFEEAVKSYNEALGIREVTFQRDADNSSAKSGLAVALARAASGFLYIDQLDRALPLAQRTVRLRRELAGEDPDNVELQRGLWVEIQTEASIHAGLGNIEQGLACNDEQLAIVRRLVEREEPFRADLTGLGQAYFTRAQLTFMRLRDLMLSEDPPNIRDHELYVELASYFEASFAAFERAKGIGALSESEKSYLKSVQDGQTLFESAIDELHAALNPE